MALHAAQAEQHGNARCRIESRMRMWSKGYASCWSMAAGLPVLGLDHQGFGAMIPDQAAIKIPVTDPAATIQGLADGIRALAASPDLGQRMGEAARRHAASESWSQRVTRMTEIYRHCVDRRGARARVPAGHGVAGAPAQLPV
jgi:glycosyltransferase involved in cell wall biosynthesis